MERRAELTPVRRWAVAAALFVAAALVPVVGLAQQDGQWDDGGEQPRVHEDDGMQWDDGDQPRFHEHRGPRFQHRQQRRHGSDMPVPQSGGTRPYWGQQQPYWGTTQPYWGPSGAPSQQLHGTTPLNRRGR